MRIDRKGRDFFIQEEGIRLDPYPDQAGYETIGIGHKLTIDEYQSGLIRIEDEFIKYRKGLTTQQVERLFNQDVSKHEAVVNREVKVPLTQDQFNALVSFSFNIGPARFRNSTLLKRLNNRNYGKIADELRRWNKIMVNGEYQVDSILKNRREREIRLFYTPAELSHYGIMPII